MLGGDFQKLADSLRKSTMSVFKDKNEKDLANELKDKREALRTFRFGVSGSKVKNTKEGNLLRKDIARILTELNRRKSV